MPGFRHRELSVGGVRSLLWRGEALIDLIGGARTISLDGRRSESRVMFPYRFDSVASSPSGEYVVLYERLGTKGIVLRGGELIREIDRSYYHAASYDYPVTLSRLADGREVLIHCPEQYNQLEIDLLETGERLTERPRGTPATDFFHSGLRTDPNGTWLMSAGWMWHPFEAVRLFNIPQALGEPAVLDRQAEPLTALHYACELSSAAYIDGARIVVAANPDADDLGDDDPEALQPGTLAVFGIASGAWESRAPMPSTAGQLLPVDRDHVLALHEHPRLIALASGLTVQEWPQIPSGNWRGCVNRRGDGTFPPMAWNAAARRLAIASPDAIHLLEPAP